MLQWFRRRAEAGRRAENLYGSVVAAARQPAFYREMGVADTPEGRFELVALHLFLLLDGMKAQNRVAQEPVQRVIETFVTDMDDCMREMGVGDMVVGKKVKRAAAAFYARAGAYRRGLAAQGGDLEDSLRTYVFAPGKAEQDGVGDGPAALAGYMRAASALTSREPFAELVADGRLGRILDDKKAEVS